MKISDRDKKLIMGVVLLAIIVLPIVFFIKPKNEEIKQKEQELVSLNERYEYLKGLSEKQEEYERQIAELSQKRSEMIADYSQGLRPENTIMFLRDIENNLSIYMEAEEFTEYVYTPVSEGEVNPENGQLEDDLTAVKTSTTVTYRTQYDHVKELLDYIFTYTTKMSISALTMTYEQETDSITGSFTLNEFAFIGSGRSVDSVDTPNLNRGNNVTPFTFFVLTSKEINGGEGEEEGNEDGNAELPE